MIIKNINNKINTKHIKLDGTFPLQATVFHDDVIDLNISKLVT